MKKVFVTGASGFLGFHLVEEMLRNGVEVYALCRKNSENLARLSEFRNINIVFGTLDDLDHIEEMCKERKFDAFYHLAWAGASGALRQDGELQIKNVLWSYKAAKAAAILECKKLIVSGTICEYQCSEIDQLSNFHPSAYYLNAKAAAYSMINSFCREESLPLVWCLFHHPVGKYNKREQLITNTVYRMLRKEPLKFGPAQNLFDVVAVEDLCRGFYLAGECRLNKTRYFIGSGAPRKLMDYFDEIKQLIDPDAVMDYGFYGADGLSMNVDWLDIGEFQKETGYQPEYSFERIILSLREWIISCIDSLSS